MDTKSVKNSLRAAGTRKARTSVILAGSLGLLLVATPSAGARNLEVQIHEVKCWDETTGKYREKFGVDTMRLAAITIEPSGIVKETRILKLGDFAKDGVLKQFTPPLRLASFAIRENLPFPLQYQAVFVLAEKDPGGGLTDQLGKFAQQGSAAALAKAKSLGATTLEAAARATVVGGGTVEGWAASVAREVLKVEVAKWFKDDVFPPKLESLRVTKKDFIWPGGKTESPRKTVIFKGNQGKYHVVYSWKLI